MGKDIGNHKMKRGKKSKKSTTKVLNAQDEEVYVVENILNKRVNEEGTVEYFIKWKDWPAETNTWEPAANLGGCEELLRAFEQNHKAGGHKEDKGGKASQKKSGDESDYDTDAVGDEKPEGEQNFEVDVLEEIPEGKYPKRVIGVVPIDKLLTYLVEWKKDGSASASGSNVDVEDYGLVKAEVFKQLHHDKVISFYQENIVWKRGDGDNTAEQASAATNKEKNRVFEAITKKSQVEMSPKQEKPEGSSSSSIASDDEAVMDTSV